MTVTDLNGGCWPTERQELLLKACLLDGNEAAQAWRLWEAKSGFDSLDHGSYRLLPLLYSKLSRLGLEHPLMAKLKGIHRKTWSETRVLTYRLANAIRLLEENGISTLMLKGVPLAALFYRDVALRPMQDIDVLVPERQALAALGLMQSNGWARKGARWPRTSGGLFKVQNALPRMEERLLLAFQNSVNLSDSENREIDLHWNVLHFASSPGADQAFWESSIPFTFEGIATRTLCATDHLLHACAHGLIWNDVPPVRWVADAAAIMRTSAIDWHRLVRLTAKLHVAVPLSDGLHYLRSVFELPVPADVLEQLSALKHARKERLGYSSLQSVPPKGLIRWMGHRPHSYFERTRGRGILFRMRLLGGWSLLSLSRVVLPKWLVKSS